MVSLLPTATSGHGERPGLIGSRSGRAAFPDPVLRAVHQTAPDRLHVTAGDPSRALSVELTLRVHPGGLLETGASVQNDGSDLYTVDALAVALPVPDRARELLDLSGRWTRERDPQRHPFVDGAHVRDPARPYRSTTAGSGDVATTPRDWATGRSIPASGWPVSPR